MLDTVTRRLALQLGLGAAGVYLAACGGSSGDAPGGQPTAAPTDAKIEDTLIIGNWIDFQSPTTSSASPATPGVKLVKSATAPKKSSLAELGAGGSRYDIVVPGSGWPRR